MEVSSIAELVGRTDLLEIDPVHANLARKCGLDLSYFLNDPAPVLTKEPNPFIEGVSELNSSILDSFKCRETSDGREMVYPILPKDRAIPAALNGFLAAERAKTRAKHDGTPVGESDPVSTANLVFNGSAGQGFAVFCRLDSR